MSVELREYHSFEECENHVQEVMAQCSEVVAFMRPSWVQLWASVRGGTGALSWLVAYRRGRPVAFLPIFRRPSLLGIDVHIQGHGLSNYLDVIALQGWEDEAMLAFARHTLFHSRGTVLHLWDVNSTFSRAAKRLARPLPPDVACAEVKLYPCPYAQLEQTWDEFFRKAWSRTKKRTELRKFARKLSGLGQLRVEVYREPIGSGLADRLLELHRLRFSQVYNPMTQPANQVFLKRVMTETLGQGPVLSTLSVDGHPISFVLGLEFNGIFSDYVSAFDPAFERYSLGHVHLMFLIQHLIEAGIKYFDFSKGAEVYKGKWSDSESWNLGYFVWRRGDLRAHLRVAAKRLALLLVVWGRSRGYNKRIKGWLGQLRSHGDRKLRDSIDVTPVLSQDLATVEWMPLRFHVFAECPLEVRRAVLHFAYEHGSGVEIALKENELYLRKLEHGGAVGIRWATA